MMSSIKSAGIRSAVVYLLTALAGTGIAAIDSAPGWDDTGITIGFLFLSAMVFGFLANRKPWLIALLTGLWIPAFELLPGFHPAAFFALVPAMIGAYAGYGISRSRSRISSSPD